MPFFGTAALLKNGVLEFCQIGSGVVNTGEYGP